MMAVYTDPINGGCACSREKCDNTCESYANRTISDKTMNYTVTRDEIAVTPNSEVAMAKEGNMSIIVRGMEMPKNCSECYLNMRRYRTDDTKKVPKCEITYHENVTKNQNRPDDCPLIPVPPNSRLIDGDLLPWFLANKTVDYASYEDWEKLCDAIRAAPTIIPASEDK